MGKNITRNGSRVRLIVYVIKSYSSGFFFRIDSLNGGLDLAFLFLDYLHFNQFHFWANQSEKRI